MLTKEFAKVCDDGMGESHEKGCGILGVNFGSFGGFARFARLLIY